LLARINEKKAELENLKELKELSASLAGQMSVLEEKLATLADGTEGMPYVAYFRYILIHLGRDYSWDHG
jgi:DASH complex subunit DAD2